MNFIFWPQPSHPIFFTTSPRFILFYFSFFRTSSQKMLCMLRQFLFDSLRKKRTKSTRVGKNIQCFPNAGFFIYM